MSFSVKEGSEKMKRKRKSIFECNTAPVHSFKEDKGTLIYGGFFKRKPEMNSEMKYVFRKIKSLRGVGE